VISGESGAGKTENARYCLNLLTNISSEESELSDKIMGCNPILEAFGNAKTIRNKNSSRFGKYTRLFVNQQNQIIGGDIVNYLLEKSRVVSH
jgi:myosin-5